MKVNVAINGFGRIGKVCLKIIEEKRLNGEDINVVAINSPSTNVEHIIYMLKYDSVYQNLIKNKIEYDNQHIKLNGNKITIFNSYNLNDIDWKSVKADYIIESSGAYRTLEKASQHLESGAKKVIISAPSDAPTFVYGINHSTYNNDMNIISNASCTTNCLTPLVKIINDKFVIEEALVSSVHSSTASQNIVDGSSKKDWRLGRSTLNNIIPTSTGAAKAVSQVLPELKGKITGLAYRIPIINGSLIDLTVRVKNKTNYDELIKEIGNNNLEKTITVTNDPIVSSDVIGNSYSCIVDKSAGIELNSNFFKLVAWYDNEYGYSCRLIDMIMYMNSQK